MEKSTKATSDRPPRRQRFPSTLRLHNRLDFERAFDGKRQASDSFLIVYAAANGLARSRLGIVASKRLGNAPRRNRMKRLLREAFRLQQHDLPKGLDFVCILKAADRPTLAQYESSLQKLTSRAQRKMDERK